MRELAFGAAAADVVDPGLGGGSDGRDRGPVEGGGFAEPLTGGVRGGCVEGHEVLLGHGQGRGRREGLLIAQYAEELSTLKW